MEFLLFLIYQLNESIRTILIKHFVVVHNRKKILCLCEVDDAMSKNRNHVDGLYAVTAYFKIKEFFHT